MLALAVLLAGCGGPGPRWQAAQPGAAQTSKARLVAAEGAGAHRLALYVARNAEGDICLGWALGSGRPAAFHCQRRGLERPVLWVQGGGGRRSSVDWGGQVGLVAPGVTRITLDGKAASLRRVRALGRWRFFAGGSETGQPASELIAYAGSRQLLDDTGLWINPDGEGCECGRDASGWFGTFAYVPEQQRGDEAHSTDLALGVPGIRKLIDAHAAWIDMSSGWESCVGTTIGQSVDIRLWKAATFRATLPYEVTAPAGRHVAYVSGAHRVLAIHSRELLVWVDTNAWRVAGVETNFDSGFAIPLGTTKKPTPGGGYDDPSKCPQGD